MCLKCFSRQAGYTYSACGPFTKSKDRILEFKEIGDSRYIYRNQVDKTCSQDDVAYGDFKDLKRRTFADKLLCNKAFNINKDPKYDGYQRGLASMAYNVLIRNTFNGEGITNENISNEGLAEANQLLESLITEKYTHHL